MRGTRQQKAAQLFNRLSIGPAFSHMAGQEPYTPEEARRQFRQWSESWVMTELCQLVPELREKLGSSGYVSHETITAARKLGDAG